jgi:two-component system cell cycle sensor histidine kinase/response regulator CckA
VTLAALSAVAVSGPVRLRQRSGVDGFSDTDERTQATLGGQAGVTLQNARLYDELQRKVTALEQELAERKRIEERTDFALAAARMGIGETALDTGCVTWSNSQAALFGIALDAFAGTIEAFFALVHAEDRAALRQEFATALANGSRDIVTEFRTIWPDGSTHWVQERARIAHDPTGRPLRMVGVSLDVTDRKLLEAQFRQAQKMEAIGMLAGGIAHDFNNMLTAILGYSELLTEQIGPDKPMGQDLREIMAAAQRAAALTQQLLAFSRQQLLALAPLDLTTVVRDVEAMLRRLLGEQITIATVLADDIDPVMADVTHLEQILVNLSVNARDAMPEGGRLTLATRNIILDAGYAAAHPGAKAGSYVTLAVTDTGAGMSSETQRRIFEPFFTTKERGRGTGLGLAAVYGIVKQLDGYIEVESQPARGSTFTIYLPRTEQAARGPIRPVPVMSPAGTETILLVEDERGVRAFMKITLQRFGYQVIEADTAEAALMLLDGSDTPVHLLLTDIVLPRMDGRELAVRVTRDRPHVHVLFMSGYASGQSTIEGFLEPGSQFLEKPFTAHALLTKTRQLLGTDGFASSSESLIDARF